MGLRSPETAPYRRPRSPGSRHSRRAGSASASVSSRRPAAAASVACRERYPLRDSHTNSPSTLASVTMVTSVPRRWAFNSSAYTVSWIHSSARTARWPQASNQVWTSPTTGSGKPRPVISRMASGKARTCGYVSGSTPGPASPGPAPSLSPASGNPQMFRYAARWPGLAGAAGRVRRSVGRVASGFPARRKGEVTAPRTREALRKFIALTLPAGSGRRRAAPGR